MRFIGISFLLLAVAVLTIESFEKPKPKACVKVCTAMFEPVCAGVKGSTTDKPISFGNACVLENYNCENGKEYTRIDNAECKNAAVRLS